MSVIALGLSNSNSDNKFIGKLQSTDGIAKKRANWKIR